MKHHKKLLVATAIAASVASMSVNAGTMGPVEPERFLLLEVGYSYMHAFYKTSVIGADSYTTTRPNGRIYDPSKVFPNDFSGGYFGFSLLTNSFLANMRYEIFATRAKTLGNNQVFTHMSPAKLAFTLDKVMHVNNNFLIGAGGGAIVSTANQAELFSYAPAGTQIGYSFPGRTRLDPLVEVLGMYKLTSNLNLKGNVSYQIPAHSFYHNGHLGVNIGVNYAIPV